MKNLHLSKKSCSFVFVIVFALAFFACGLNLVFGANDVARQNAVVLADETISGGAVRNVTGSGDSISGNVTTSTGVINVTGGSITGTVTISGAGVLNITGGTVGAVSISNGGRLNMTGGSITGTVTADGTSTIITIADDAQFSGRVTLKNNARFIVKTCTKSALTNKITVSVDNVANYLKGKTVFAEFGDSTIASSNGQFTVYSGSDVVPTTLDGTNLYLGAIVTKPTLSQTSFVYTGSLIDAASSLNGFDSSKMEISGTSSATDVEDYTFKVSVSSTAKFTYFDQNGTTSVDFSWHITRKPISAPSAKTGLTYNGLQQTGVEPGTGYTVTGNTGTDAGEYEATATLDSNYMWTDGSTAQKTIPWSIGKLGISIPQGKVLTYNGSQQIGVAGGNGYSLTGTSKATDAGEYEAIATLGSNYKWLDGSIDPKTIPWSIGKLGISIPQGKALTYNGSQQTGVEPGPSYTLTGHTGTNAGQYTATVTPKSNYMWSDDNSSGEKQIGWSIAKASITLTVSTSSYPKNYGDANFDVTVSINGRKGSDTFQLSVSSTDPNIVSVPTNVSGGASASITNTIIGIGTTTINVSFDGNDNYNAATSTSYTVTVDKKKIKIPVFDNGIGEFTYNAKEYNVLSMGKLSGYPDIAKYVTPSGTTSATVVRTDNNGLYEFVLTISDVAHNEFSDGTSSKTYQWRINKAKPTITANDVTAIYGDGSKTSTISVSNWYESTNAQLNVESNNNGVATVSISGYSVTNTINGNGKATITVSFAGNSNYEPASKTYTVTVGKKKVAIPTAKTGLVYTGTEQTGVEPGTGYTVKDNTGTDARQYNAIATLESNYQWANGTEIQQTIAWNIAPKELSISWTGDSFEYNGKEQKPSTSGTVSGVNGEVVNISVDGGQIDAGSGYTATATIASVTGGQTKAENYTISTATKTHNFAITAKNIDVVWDAYTNPEYDGRAHAIPTATASSGVLGETINLSVVANKSGDATTLTQVTEAGDYVATATIASVTGRQAKVANYSLSATSTKNFKVVKREKLTATNKTILVDEAIDLTTLVSGNVGTLSFDASSSVSGTGIQKNWSSPTLTVTGLPQDDDTDKTFTITVKEAQTEEFANSRTTTFVLTVSKKKASLSWADSSILSIAYGDTVSLLANAVVGTETYSQIVYESNNQAILIDPASGEATAKAIADGVKIFASVASTSKIAGAKIERQINAVKKVVTQPTLKTGTSIVYDGKAKSLVDYLDNFDAGIMEISSNATATKAKKGIESTIKFKDEVANFHLWQNTSDATITITWTIAKAQVTKPSIASGQEFTYDGQQKQLQITLDDGLVGKVISVQNNTGTDAGSYDAVVSLVYGDDYEWADGTVDNISSSWTIMPATINLPTFAKTWLEDGKYQNTVNGIVGKTVVANYTPFANVIGTYSYSTQPILSDGQFGVTLQDGTDKASNYVLGTVGDFVINNSPIEKPIAMDYTFEYNGNEHSIVFNRSLESAIVVTGNSATNVKYDADAKQIGSYTVTLSLKPNYVWNDNTTDPIMYNLTITQKKLALPTATTQTLEYNASVAEYEIDLQYDSSKVGIDSSSDATKVTHAGEYKVIFNIEDTNYCFVSGKNVSDDRMQYTLTWQVKPISCKKPTRQKNFTYDGEVHTVALKDFDRTIMSESGEMSEIDAGEYIVTVSLLDNVNYVWEDGTTADLSVVWKIDRFLVDAPIAGTTTFTYTGDIITYLPVRNYDQSKMKISGNKETRAGEYTATISLISNNYIWFGYPDTDWTQTWKINKKTLTAPKLVGKYVYDRTNQKAQLDDNFDENTMIVTGNTKTDAGTTIITIELADPDDYQWSTNDTRAVSIEWTIEKAVLDAPALKQKQFTFDGKRKEVELVDDDGYIMTGDQKAVNAGEYQVVVAVENSNYAIEGTNEPNVTLAWTINKAVLAIPTLETSQPFVYDGNEHTPEIAGFDNATMIISGQTTGVNAGIYKFRVELKDKDNYVWSDGTIGAKTFGWTIDRSNNLLIIIISICLAVAVSSIVLTIVFVNKKKKKKKAQLLKQEQ